MMEMMTFEQARTVLARSFFQLCVDEFRRKYFAREDEPKPMDALHEEFKSITVKMKDEKGVERLVLAFACGFYGELLRRQQDLVNLAKEKGGSNLERAEGWECFDSIVVARTPFFRHTFSFHPVNNLLD